MGDKGSSSQNTKPYVINNIKTYVPLILDLNELNYDAWRELFETHCRSFGMLDHVNGKSKPSGDTDEEWYAQNSLVKNCIYGTLTQSLLLMVVKIDSTANSVWLSLETLFRDNKHARAIELEDQLRTIQLGDLSITEYCQKIKSIADLLWNIDAAVPERTVVTHLLNGLGDKYENISTMLRHSDQPITLLSVGSKLFVEEHRASRAPRTTPVASPHKDHASNEQQSKPFQRKQLQRWAWWPW